MSVLSANKSHDRLFFLVLINKKEGLFTLYINLLYKRCVEILFQLEYGNISYLGNSGIAEAIISVTSFNSSPRSNNTP